MPSSASVTALLTLAIAGIAVPGGAAVASAQSAGPLLSPAPQDVPPTASQGEGPRGTSGAASEDTVGHAGLIVGPADARFGAVAIGVGHPSLPLGSFVEVTALDTGRTIVAMVVARSDTGAVVALSPAAARALGVGDHAAVRVRLAAVGVQDQRALRSGQAASPRLDAPPTLLAALRHKLPPQQASDARSPPDRSPPIRKMTPAVRAAPAIPVKASGRSGFVVQVAALSSPDRAAALARQLGGHVDAVGALYRIQLGPFPDVPSAQRARDGVARKGYGDARILHIE